MSGRLHTDFALSFVVITISNTGNCWMQWAVLKTHRRLVSGADIYFSWETLQKEVTRTLADIAYNIEWKHMLRKRGKHGLPDVTTCSLELFTVQSNGNVTAWHQYQPIVYWGECSTLTVSPGLCGTRHILVGYTWSSNQTDLSLSFRGLFLLVHAGLPRA